jgi:hypothetical protein
LLNPICGKIAIVSTSGSREEILTSEIILEVRRKFFWSIQEKSGYGSPGVYLRLYAQDHKLFLKITNLLQTD